MSSIHTNRLIFALTCIGISLTCRSLDLTTPNLQVKVLAEVQIRAVEQGRSVTKLVAADKVVPGDLVLYTLEARNAAPRALDAPLIVQPIPAHMVYVANSAAGPGSAITFSVDSGHSFDRPENLSVIGANGERRHAVPADYTHIRWQMKSLVKSNSVAFVRFRARVK